VTKTIQGVISKAQTLILAACPSLLNAPELPTDQRFEKTIIAYPNNILFKKRSDGFTNTFFDLQLEVKVSRKDLTEAMRFLLPLPEQICQVFLNDPSIGGTCQTYGGNELPIKCTLTTETVNGITSIGWEIVVPSVKI
jgi:hypothetical protein